MLYKSILTKTFIKEFKKLPENERPRLLEAIEKITENPYAGLRLRGKLEGLWRWRIGKYRIIYFISEKEKAVIFLDVGLKKTIYKR